MPEENTNDFVARLCEQATETVQIKEQIKSLQIEGELPDFCQDSYNTVMLGGHSQFPAMD